MRIAVRSTRSYMAGLGTSGSLVAGAALLFVLASAIVAFRGWPQIATGPATSAVSATAQPTAPSHAARRLAAVLRRPGAITGGTIHAAGSRPRAAGFHRRTAVKGQTVVATRPVSSGPGSGGGGSSASGSSGNSAGSGGCSPATCTRPQSLISHLTNTISQQVTSIGASIGPAVSSTTGTAGNDINGVNPPAGTVVENAGSTAGSALSGSTSTAGSVITQTGDTLSGGH